MQVSRVFFKHNRCRRSKTCIHTLLLWLNMLENWFVSILQKDLVGPSQKNSFWALEKRKMKFPSKENENFLRQHCLSFQYAPLCTIWDHLNKLCHECGHKIDHFAWKHESSHFIAHFWEHFFKIITVLQVYYFSC